MLFCQATAEVTYEYIQNHIGNEIYLPRFLLKGDYNNDKLNENNNLLLDVTILLCINHTSKQLGVSEG